MKLLWLVPALIFSIAACSGDDDSAKRSTARPSDVTSPPSTAVPGNPPVPPKAPSPGWNWTWPSKSGPTRDLVTDQNACRDRVDKASAPLTQIKEFWDCMQANGWRREESERTKPMKTILAELWSWGGDPAGAHDLTTDDAACKAQMHKDAEPLVQTRQYLDCMIAEGWRQNEVAWQNLRTRRRAAAGRPSAKD